MEQPEVQILPRKGRLFGLIVRNLRIDSSNDTDRDRLGQYRRQYLKFTRLRGKIIDAALDIEGLLTAVLLHFLVGSDYKRHDLLRTLIFDAEFCTFMQKRRILSRLFEMYPSERLGTTVTNAKILRQELNQLILDRDMFAHGTLFVDASNDKLFIRFSRNGEREIEVNNETVRKTLKRAEKVSKTLSHLNEYLANHDARRSKKESTGRLDNLIRKNRK